MTHRTILSFAALMGALAVLIGAFGAHLFHDTLALSGRTETFELASRYQFYHTLALLVVGLLKRNYSSPRLLWAAYCFVGGILLFSGSLYLLALLDESRWGIVTPFGGVLLIGGWLLMAFGVAENKKNQG